jgi:hypothetical protein
MEGTLKEREVIESDEERIDGTPLSLIIGETSVANASAQFTDLALPLPFEAAITKLNGSISTLSSASDAPARVDMEGQVNEYGQLAISGTLRPFAPTTGTDLRIAFENVNLPRMSPYTIKFAGRRIDDGRTDLELTLRLTDGQLDGDNHLVIRDLELGETIPQPGAMDLPLDLVVALLKDPSGTVDFSFPVTGAFDDPEFSYAGAVAKAFSNLVLGLATSPFRLLGSLVGIQASDIERVAFKAGRADLSPPQREVLDKLTDALTQRPQLTLELQPVLDPRADRRALQVALLDARVDELIEAAETDPSELLAERRLEVLQSLHADAELDPDRSELELLHTGAGENGQPVLDTVAYAEVLRLALIDATVIDDAELERLAESRAAAVIDQLTTGGLGAERIRSAELSEQAAEDEGIIHMPLDVITAG